MRLEYVPFAEHSPGLIAHLLRTSYALLLEGLPGYRAEELLQAWLEYDAAVYAEPDTIGACGFYSQLGSEVVGLGSWDPRQWPEAGRIGHNCVLPRYQRRGYGQLQIVEILKRFKDAGFRKAVVHTDEHPFFEPARRMYLSLSFAESRRYAGELMAQYSMVEYERSL